MNDTYKFKMPDNLPDEAREILEHLHSTGTGLGKLRLIAALALQSKSLEEFLAGAKSSLPEITWKKVESFIEGKLKEARAEEIALVKVYKETGLKEEKAKEATEETQEEPQKAEGASDTSELSEAEEEATEKPEEPSEKHSKKGRNRH